MYSFLKSNILKLQAWGFKGVLNFPHRWFEDKLNRWALWRNYRKFRDVVPTRGITVIAPLSMQYSNSKVVRDFAFSLKKAGLPFQTFDTNHHPQIPRVDFADILTPEEEFQVTKYDHVVEIFKSPLPKGIVKQRARIAFWEGESGMLDVFPYLASSDPVIGMSDFNVAYFRKELPPTTPVYKILYPLQWENQAPDPRGSIRERYGIGWKDFVVFFNFDFGSFFRKNPEGIIRAFAKAFPDVQNVKLIFKTKLADQFADKVIFLERLAVDLGIQHRLIWIHDYLSSDDLYELTSTCDVYISLHRAEGFGIGITEAMSFGKAVVATDYSASTEFCRPDSSIPIPYKMVPILSNEYFVTMKEWADPDIDAAAAALRKLYNDPVYCKELGHKAKVFIEEYFSNENFKKTVNAFLQDGASPEWKESGATI